MKRLLIAVTLLLLPAHAAADEINVKVKGMVCSFCAQGIKKAFSKLPEVKKVEPTLEEKLVFIETTEGAELSDEKVTEMINDAGYDVVAIERRKPS